VSQKSLKNNKSSQALLELTWGISKLNKLLRAREKALSETKVILEEAKSKFNSPNFKSLSAFAQTRIKQDVAYYTGLVIDKEKEIKGLYILRDESIKVYERMKEIESLLDHRLTVREIHKLRHLISQLEPKDQKEYRDRMQDSLRRFRMGDEKACPICLEKITEKEIASDKVIGCTFSNATKAEQERYLKEKGINSTGRSAIIKFFGNCCSKAKKVRTTCGEHYHIDCIRGWNKDTCPTCRRPVSADTRRRVSGDRKEMNPRLRKPGTGGWGKKALKAVFLGSLPAAAIFRAGKEALEVAAENRHGPAYTMNRHYPGVMPRCSYDLDSPDLIPCPLGSGKGGFPLTYTFRDTHATPIGDSYPELEPNPAEHDSPNICEPTGLCMSIDDPRVLEKYCKNEDCTRGERYRAFLEKSATLKELGVPGVKREQRKGTSSTINQTPAGDTTGMLLATSAGAALASQYLR